MSKLIATSFFILAGAILLSNSCLGQSDHRSTIHNRIFDHANLLTPWEEDSLFYFIQQLEKEAGSQIGIITLDSLPGESIETYSFRTANKLGLGRSAFDDGLMITVVRGSREIRLEVGIGLENVVTNSIAGDINRNIMAPEFRASKFYDGLKYAIVELSRLVKANVESIGYSGKNCIKGEIEYSTATYSKEIFIDSRSGYFLDSLLKKPVTNYFCGHQIKRLPTKGVDRQRPTSSEHHAIEPLFINLANFNGVYAKRIWKYSGTARRSIRFRCGFHHGIFIISNNTYVDLTDNPKKNERLIRNLLADEFTKEELARIISYFRYNIICDHFTFLRPYYIKKGQLIVFDAEQSHHKKLIDSLKYVTNMPYVCETEDKAGCGDRFFWNVVKQKQLIVPFLIDALTDTTTTQAAVPNIGGQWTVADIAYHALTEIVQGIPTFELLGVPFDNEGCGFCSYWNRLRSDIGNRRKFQTNVSEWYDQNKTQLVWVESNEFQTCDCRGTHPNGGHFELRTK